MTDKLTDPVEFFQFSKNLMAAQEKFLPSGQVFGRLSEATRIITQAQVAYGQALMRANAAMFGAWLDDQSAPPAKELRPSVAARRPDIAAE